MEKPTVPPKWLKLVTVIVDEPVALAWMTSEFGLADSE